MRALCLVVAVVASFALTVGHAQAPAAAPTFDVVSIKLSAPETGPTFTANILTQRPDGGMTITRTRAVLLIARAYPGMVTADMVGLPDWATRDFYDVSATASLSSVTGAARLARLRAMLADRFRLVTHFERREVPSFDLAVARGDGRLGSGLTPIDLDCDAVAESRQRDAILPQPVDSTALPPCRLRLDSSRTERDVLVIDRLERPTEN
jgi:hypothetical protein